MQPELSRMSPNRQARPPGEPEELILASAVLRKPIYDRSGEKMGHVEDIAIFKRSGRAPYAITSIGGFLGLGERYHPIPWEALTYDLDLGGYVVRLSHDELRAAPTYEKEQLSDIGEDDLKAHWVFI